MNDNRNQQTGDEQCNNDNHRDAQRQNQQEVSGHPQVDTGRSEMENDESRGADDTRNHMSHYASNGDGEGGGGTLY